MPKGRSGIITEEFKGKENTAYHDVEKLFKIYRSVNWKMQIKINQVKRHFQLEYGTDVDKFLDSLYQAGMDVDGTILQAADQIVDAVKAGAIRHFFLVGGCDGARKGRNYYTEFVKQTPADTIILTLACGKYRFNDLDLGSIGGFPRIMDMGQCNDAYGAIKVAVALAEAFDCGVNELPLSMVLSWYEQKAVCILLTLLHLGIKNIYLGPSLPAFLSPNVLQYLVENYQISPIGDPKEDMEKMLG